MVGHAFGNRVARMLATDRPDLVRAVALVAANIGKAPSPPQVRAGDPQQRRSVAVRRGAHRGAAIRLLRARQRSARLARRAGIPRCWRRSESPAIAPRGRRTSPAGRAPILYLQPDHDPLAHVEDARAYQEQFGERVTVVVIERASHAVIAEQPDAVSAALIAYARELWPHAMLQ